MRSQTWIAAVVVWMCGLTLPGTASIALGQVAGGATGTTTGGQAGTTTGAQAGGTAAAQVGGIAVDPEGVVRAVFVRDATGKLAIKRREEAASKNLPSDLNTYSKLRKVSLVRLEKACLKFADEQKNVSPDMQYLAGLQRIDYVFVFPETQDLVLAGPAEGFATDPTGRAVGITTGRPPLRLDDLIVALRALERGGMLGCSIDVRPDNMNQLRRYLAANSYPAASDVAKARFGDMARVLGMQDVRIMGIPSESHFASVLVEADYRMKRISMGLESSGIRGLPSHLSMIAPGQNTIQRWWFTPLYDTCIRSDDGLAYQLAGQRAQLLAEEELPTASGNLTKAATTRVSTKRFAQRFTDKFTELADKSPAFAELQNLIDLSIVAALFKKDRLPDKVSWSRSLFLDEARAKFVKYNVPRQVPSAANFRDAGKVIVGLVGGGVTIQPLETAGSLEFKQDEGEAVAGARKKSEQIRETDPEHPWWWD